MDAESFILEAFGMIGKCSGTIRDDREPFWKASALIRERSASLRRLSAIPSGSRIMPNRRGIDAEGFQKTPKGSRTNAECMPKVCGMSYEPLQIVSEDADSAQKMHVYNYHVDQYLKKSGHQ